MAKKTIKKKKKVLYAYPGLSVPPADPYANMDPYTRQALGLPPVQQTMAGEAPPTGDSMGDSMAGGSPMTGIASAASEAGRAAGVAASDLFAVGLPLLNSLIPDNNKQKRPTPQMAYNPHPYGTGSSALYASGGDIISPLRSGELRVEDNQFSYLSPETINLGGDYHSEGGTNLQYGGNIVEAERGEPVSIGEDGQAVVWGNMYLPGTNKKFKSVAKKIAREEAKNTNLLGKATKLLQTSNPYNSYEALSFSSGEVINKAAKLREESVRAEKDALANLQQSLLDYAELTGQKPEKISKQFKKGGKMPCMDCGGKLEDGGFLPIAGDEFNIAAYPNFPPEYPESLEEAKDGKWIQKAVNPKHKGYCTPMTKKTCTPRRKALARTFKKHHGFHENGGEVYEAQGGIKMPVSYNPNFPYPNYSNIHNVGRNPNHQDTLNYNSDFQDATQRNGFYQRNLESDQQYGNVGIKGVMEEGNWDVYNLLQNRRAAYQDATSNPGPDGMDRAVNQVVGNPQLNPKLLKKYGMKPKMDDGGNVTRIRNEEKIKITEEIPQSILDAQMRAQMPQSLDNQLNTQQFMPQARPVPPVHVQPSQDIVYEKLTTADGRPLYAPKFPKNWSKKKIQNTWNNIPNMIGGREVLKGSSWQDVQQVPGWQYSDTTGSRFLPNVARPEHRPNNFRPAFSKLANGGTIEDIQEGQEVDLTPEEYAYLQSIGYSFE